jgi:hypothetical protein
MDFQSKTWLQKQPRKTCLDPFAKSLCIIPSLFKNKQTLIEHILYIQSKPRSQRCYNETDPYSLESIDDIPTEYYIEWTQYNHRFGADIRTISIMFDNHQYILPWSLDFVSSKSLTSDDVIEQYKKNFDMRNVIDIEKRVRIYKQEQEHHPNDCVDSDLTYKISFDTCFVHELEQCCGNTGYLTGIIANLLLSEKDTRKIYQQISKSLYKMLFHLQSDTNYIMYDVFYQYMYLQYTIRSFHIHDHEEHLQYFLELVKQFIHIYDTDGMSVIHFVILELGE